MRNRYRVRLAGPLAGLLMLGVVAVGAQSPKQEPARLALVGGMLLDGYEVPPLHHAAILIEGNKIVWVGPAADARIPPDATVIDTRGRVMMPGLVELHSHLMHIGHGLYPRWWAWVAERGVLERIMEISAKQFLMAGITSLVDLGGPLKESLRVRDRVRRHEIPGPRLWMSGPWIRRTGGAGSQEPFTFAWKEPVRTPEQAAQYAEELAAAGVDVIKAHAGLTREDLAAIVKVARRHNLKVHAHVYDEPDVRNALETGVDVLTHVGSAGRTPPYSAELIRDIVNAGRPVVVTSTHRSWIFPATVDFPERLQDPQLKADFASVPGLWEEMQGSFTNWHTLPYFRTVDRERSLRERGLKQFIESGAVMGIGVDGGTPLNFNTESVWREITAHVEMGMAPQAAISAATRIGARILGRAQDLGTIEPGKLADVIVVRGNPLFNITALADVEVVVKDGMIFKGGPAARRGAPTAR